MRIGIVGSGQVAQTLARKLVEVGHDLLLGTREPGKLAGFAAGSALDAARHGEVVINATAGGGSLQALEAAGRANLDGKVLIDVANPLDFSKGMPPSLTIVNTDSLGERIQAAFPGAKVVKALNTVNVDLMVAPEKLAGGDHHLFLCGNDAGAKADVTRWLSEWFGWRNFVDVGDITAARGTEMYLALWIRLYAKFGTGRFNVKIVR
jgi:8-hydroxy-5-deazaflavin:NADPH oxidoreductase